jgi:hypothetical protein
VVHLVGSLEALSENFGIAHFVSSNQILSEILSIHLIFAHLSMYKCFNKIRK